MSIETGAAPVVAGPPETTRSSHAPARFPCFDGLRALAALAVVIFHVMPSLEPGWYTWWLGEWLAGLGSLGVRTFFVVSGFLLYRPFVVAFFESRPSPDAFAFWRRRFLRVFPSYWVALTVYVYVFGFAPIRSPGLGLMYYGLAQNYRYASALGGLFVAWTLVIEISFYVVLPFLALGLRALAAGRMSLRAKFVSQLGGLAVVFAFGVAVRAWVVWTHPTSARAWFPIQQIGTWLPGFLEVFAIGMLFAVLSAWRASGGRLVRPIESLGRFPAVCWLLALEVYWVSQQFNKPATRFAKATEIQAFGVPSVVLLVAALLVFPAVFGPQDRGSVRRFLRTPVLVFLGMISYGIYLWHDTVIKVVRDELGPQYLLDHPLVGLAFILGGSVLVGYVNYRLIERPLVRWSQRRGRRFGRRSPGTI